MGFIHAVVRCSIWESQTQGFGQSSFHSFAIKDLPTLFVDNGIRGNMGSGATRAISARVLSTLPCTISCFVQSLWSNRCTWSVIRSLYFYNFLSCKNGYVYSCIFIILLIYIYMYKYIYIYADIKTYPSRAYGIIELSPKVSRAKWYMLHYGSLTPKPHYAWCNSNAIGGLNMGRLLGWKKRLALGDVPKVKTCETYKDKNGRTRYKGTAALRKTEYLNFVMGICIIFMVSPILILGGTDQMVLLFPYILHQFKQASYFILLREYPVRFGFKLVDLDHDLTTSSRGRAPFPIDPAGIPSAVESFRRMPEDAHALQFAQLDQVFNYLRRGKHMVIPKEWKNLVPNPK